MGLAARQLRQKAAGSSVIQLGQAVGRRAPASPPSPAASTCGCKRVLPGWAAQGTGTRTLLGPPAQPLGTSLPWKRLGDSIHTRSRSSVPSAGNPEANTAPATCHPRPQALAGSDAHVSDAKYQTKLPQPRRYRPWWESMQTFSTVAGYRLPPTLHQYIAVGREQSPPHSNGAGTGSAVMGRAGRLQTELGGCPVPEQCCPGTAPLSTPVPTTAVGSGWAHRSRSRALLRHQHPPVG